MKMIWLQKESNLQSLIQPFRDETYSASGFPVQIKSNIPIQ